MKSLFAGLVCCAALGWQGCDRPQNRPGTATTVPSPAQQADHRFKGTLDLVSSTEIAGWASDASNPDARLQVEVLADDQPIAHITADRYRRDLEKAGIGDGKFGFQIEVPQRLKDGQTHSVRARIIGADRDLQASPKTLTVSNPPAGAVAGNRP